MADKPPTVTVKFTTELEYPATVWYAILTGVGVRTNDVPDGIAFWTTQDGELVAHIADSCAVTDFTITDSTVQDLLELHKHL